MSSTLISLTIDNYKRFPSFKIDLEKNILIFTGPNGSGKTQLLWSCLIFFHAFNRNCRKSPSNAVLINTKDLATLLCCTPLIDLSSYLSFANTHKDEKDCIRFLGEFSNHQILQINWEVNGKAEFNYQSASMVSIRRSDLLSNH